MKIDETAVRKIKAEQLVAESFRKIFPLEAVVAARNYSLPDHALQSSCMKEDTIVLIKVPQEPREHFCPSRQHTN